MNNNYGIPLFENSDYEAALEYINDSLFEVKGAKMVQIDPDGNQQEIPIRDGLVSNMFKDITSRMYGVNVPLMANYCKVEELWLDKLYPHISKYLSIKGYKSYNIAIDTSAITSTGLRMRFSNLTKVPLSRWDPREPWDDKLEYTPGAIDKNLMNPTNKFYNVVFSIIADNDSVIPHGFIDRLHKLGINFRFVDTMRPMKELDYTQHQYGTKRVNIYLLPDKSPYACTTLVKLIHKYF